MRERIGTTFAGRHWSASGAESQFRGVEPRLALADDGSEFLQTARQIVAKTLEGSNQEEKTDWGVMKEKIRADLKRYIVKETSRRPLIIPVILEI
jgi:mRNA degradation ribonuclease J1/J2